MTQGMLFKGVYLELRHIYSQEYSLLNFNIGNVLNVLAHLDFIF